MKLYLHQALNDVPCSLAYVGAQNTPSMASGVTSKVTQGMATALASSPTSETWLNSSSDKGVSASVTTHCSRAARSRPASGLASRGGKMRDASSFFKSNWPPAL